MADFATCAGCGKQVSAGLTWCPFCGREFAAEPAAPDEVSEQLGEEFAAPEPPEPADAEEPAEDPAPPPPDPPPPMPPPEPTSSIPTPPEPAEPDSSLPAADRPADTTPCGECDRSIDPRLTWCPYCGTRQEPAGPPPPVVDLPPPPEGELPDPADPGDDAASLPSPPPEPRRSGPPLGVEAPRQAPDLDRERRKVRRRMIAGVVMSIVLILGSLAFVAVMFTLLLSSSDNGDSADGEAAPGDLPEEVFTAFTPATGDCLIYRSDGEIEKEDCDVPHGGEVFDVTRYAPTATPFPGEQALSSFADEACLSTFRTYVGVNYWASGLTFVYIYPTAEGWADGDRLITCVAEDPFGAPLTATVRSSDGIDHPGLVPFSLLQPGTCWDFNDDGTELVAVVDCALPHDAETFGSIDFPTTVFPGNDAIVAVGEEECGARYASYATDVAESTDWFAFTPTDFEWKYGYRVVTCTLFSPDGVKLTGSARG